MVQDENRIPDCKDPGHETGLLKWIKMIDNYKIQPPDRAQTLYDSIFGSSNRDNILNIISGGIHGVIENAAGLLQDAETLLKAESYPRAVFLVTTADEEMAKAYILSDMCHLDFNRHESVLMKLCKAFYNHIIKYAYNQVIRFPRVHDLKHAGEIYKASIQKWFPSGNIENGEPDMPHDTVFRREYNLYVDYIEFDENWNIPTQEQGKLYFEGSFPTVIDILNESHNALKKIIFTKDIGLYEPDALKCLNEVFSHHRIKENTSTQELNRLKAKVVSKLNPNSETIIDDIINSEFMNYPLYSFVETLT